MLRVLAILLFATSTAWAQTGSISGVITSHGQPMPFVNVMLESTLNGATTDEDGRFQITNISPGKYSVKISGIGYQKQVVSVDLTTSSELNITIELKEAVSQLDEVVVTGTMKEVTKMNSPIPIEVYSPSFFLKNPTPNIFEALSMVNGVQPQINCNVCNTGDIHINGLEGPYTMILIDGMPIVSSLATVYGLAGIPNSMVKRMEVVKGPASTLYGSEAVGGVINIITQDPGSAPALKVDAFGTSVGEVNLDVSSGFKAGKAFSLLGVNYFHYNQRRDINQDNFTDITLQKRFSLFNKWNFHRASGKNFSMAGRLFHENRWGGEIQWTPAFRGSDQIYGESVTTDRVELIGNYQFNTSTPFHFDYSYNYHHQDSYYGTTPYLASQHVGFAQLRWNKKMGSHDLLAGVPVRYIFYDDNTVGTAQSDGSNQPDVTFLPGIFVQDDIILSPKVTTLAGVRYDRHNVHGNIVTPRLSFKYSPNALNTFRLTGGNGYRVVNLFTEDHAALSGSREVLILNDLKPEKSWNVNANYMRQVVMKNGFITLDGSLFYTYFTNKIVGDFLTDPTSIIYDNLDGYAISRGATLNVDAAWDNGLKVISGITYMDVFQIERNETTDIRLPQLHAPRFSGTFTVSYAHQPTALSIDLTSRINGPMHLPVLENDFRASQSPWFALVNLQITKSINPSLDVYAGVKNLLNFLPKNPLMHPDDPFDRAGGKYFDSDGNPRPDTNPHGYTFDTTYNYAPMQGTRALLGLRWTLN